MEQKSKIYVAGNTGLVGSAIVRKLHEDGYNNLVYTPYPEYDLINQSQVEDFFKSKRPEYVVLAAAKVGGIVANNTYRAQFIYENIMIQSNIIHCAYKYDVKKLLFLGSSCIYPKLCKQPIAEEYLLTDTLEYTNEPYAIAKIAGIKTVESYNLQYGTNFIAVMPTNLYGYNDNFDLEKSHVLPAILRKMHLAKALMNENWDTIRQDLNKYPIEKVTGESDMNCILDILHKYGIIRTNKTAEVKLWGTGTPKREFLHANDLADACVFIMKNLNFTDILLKEYNITDYSYPMTTPEIKNTHINIGIGKDLTILQLAEMIKNTVGFEGNIEWDTNKPDGTPQKLLNVEKINGYGWKPKITMQEGIAKIYQNYILYTN